MYLSPEVSIPTEEVDGCHTVGQARPQCGLPYLALYLPVGLQVQSPLCLQASRWRRRDQYPLAISPWMGLRSVALYAVVREPSRLSPCHTLQLSALESLTSKGRLGGIIHNNVIQSEGYCAWYWKMLALLVGSTMKCLLLFALRPVGRRRVAKDSLYESENQCRKLSDRRLGSPRAYAAL